MRLCLIASILAVAFGIFLILSLSNVVNVSFAAVNLAFVVCVLGALLGHVLSEYPKGNEFILTRLLASMFVRAGLPLAAVVFVKLFLNSIFDPGFVYLVVLFYLVGLISEAVLSVARLKLSGIGN